MRYISDTVAPYAAITCIAESYNFAAAATFTKHATLKFIKVLKNVFLIKRVKTL
jgi:hypothetical protein